MSNSQQILGTEPIGKLLLRYSLPAIIGMMVNGLYNVVDRVFIGNMPGVGPLAITGLGVTMPVMTIILAFGMLIGIGAATNISIKLGQGKKDEAEKLIGNSITLSVIVGLIIMAIGLLFGDQILKVFGASEDSLQYAKAEAEKLIGNSITLSVIVGLIIMAIGLLFGDQILKVFGASEDSLQYAKAYINIILIGTVFNLIGFVFNSTIRGDGNPKLSAKIMIVGCVLNIILDAVFIFVVNMGIRGAALATIISQFITAIWGLSYYIKGKSNLKLNKSNLKLDKSLVYTIIVIGAAPFAMQIAASGVQVISNNALRTYGGDLAIGAMATINSIIMMVVVIGAAPFAMQIAASGVQVISNNALRTYGGDLAIGAMATINSIIMMVGLPIVGISQGAQPIIGFNYGCKKYDRVEQTLKLATIASTIGLTIGWVVVQLYPEPIVSMFNRDSELLNISVDGIRKYLFMMPLIGMSMIGSNYIQSIGNAKQSMFLGLLRQVILLVPMMLILPKFLGLDGVWFSQPVADVISFIITFIVVNKEVKSHKDKDIEDAA